MSKTALPPRPPPVTDFDYGVPWKVVIEMCAAGVEAMEHPYYKKYNFPDQRVRYIYEVMETVRRKHLKRRKGE